MDFKTSLVLDDNPLYRIMPLRRLREMIENHQNTLVRPSSWDDPYETVYNKSIIATPDGDTFLDGSYWFGQCWSLCKESALMWQAFKKKEEPYVKIMVSPVNLLKDLNEQKRNLRIGVLDYIRYFNPTVEDYKEKIEEVMFMHKWTTNFLRQGATLAELYPLHCLLTKRIVFAHEEEVRLLIFDKSVQKDQKTISYSFSPSNIKEVVLDPWVKDEEFNKIKEELNSLLSDNNIRIEKSSIFEDSAKFTIRYTICNNYNSNKQN